MDYIRSSDNRSKHKLKRFLIFSIFLSIFLFLMPIQAEAAEWETGTVSDLGMAFYYLSEGTNGYQSGDTFKLTNDITYTGNIYMNGKAITFDLNGHTLTVNNSLTVVNGGSINLTGAGSLNVNGQVSVDGSGSSVTVNNVSNSSYGVVSSNGGTATVNGNITVNAPSLTVDGVYISSGSGTVTVNGNITITGNNCNGVETFRDASNARITVTGGISASGNNTYGAYIAGTSNTVSITGDVAADYVGLSINSSYTGNIITVGGNVTSRSQSNGRGASIGFGSEHSITVDGDVTVNGSGSGYGVLISGSTSSDIEVGGSVVTTGDQVTGAYVTGSSNQATISGDLITAWKSPDVYTTNSVGADVSGAGSKITVLGDIEATNTGANAIGGATVEVGGSITVTRPDNQFSYTGANCDGGTVTVGADLSIAGPGPNTALWVENGTATVSGNVSASSSSSNAYGLQIDTGGTVSVSGNVTAIGASYSVRAINSYAAVNVTVGGIASAQGGDNPTGVYASGGGNITIGKAISAANYIKTYSSNETRFNVGSGTLNGGYYEYACASGTTVRVKAWGLTVQANMGGAAGIGGTTVTSGSYEAGATVSIEAVDTVVGWDFDEWFSEDVDSFANVNNASTTFTMPMSSAWINARFKLADTYVITTPVLSGGSITADPTSQEAGKPVTLTIVPDPGKKYVTGSLQYHYGGADYPLTVNGDTATFNMTASAVSVTAQFEDITAPVVTTASLPVGTITVSYSQTLAQASNTAAVWSLTAGTLPDGLSLSTTGAITGTPSVAGIFTFTVQATNGGGSDTQELTITVAGADPVITPTSLPEGTEDEAYSFTFEATGAGDIYWYVSEGNLPGGLTLDYYGGLSGTITSEISQDTTYTFKVTAYNDYDISDTKQFSLTVHPAPEYALTIQAAPSGSITTGSSILCEADTVISIGATPDQGYIFSSWTSSAGGAFANTGSAITTFTMPESETIVTANFIIGYDVIIPDMAGGSVTASKTLVKEAESVTLTIEPDPGSTYVDGSLTYSYGGSEYPLAVEDSTAVFTMPASDVTISAEFEAKPAIEASSAAELEAALDSMTDGDTIKLLNDITYQNSIRIDGIRVTFDLNGHTLSLDVATEMSDYFYALGAINPGGSILTTGAGMFNVRSDYVGVYAGDGGRISMTGDITTICDGGCAVTTSGEASSITITGDITEIGSYGHAVYAYGSDVTVTGDVVSNGYNNYGVEANSSTVDIIGNISAGDHSRGAVAASESTVTVSGYVTASGAESKGVYAYGSTVTINKGIQVPIYIALEDDQYTETIYNISQGTWNDGSGYFEYTIEDPLSTVRVKGWDFIARADTGGSIPEDVSGNYEAGALIELAAAKADNFSFLQWSTSGGGVFTSPGSLSTNFTMPANAVTVTASFQAPVNQGGSGGGTNNTPGTTTTTTNNMTTSSTTTTATRDSSSLTARASVDTQQLTATLAKAKEEAAAQGNNYGIEIKVEADQGTNSISTSIPKSAFNSVTESDASSLTLNTPIASVAFNSTALNTINSNASDNITITVAKSDATSLNNLTEEQKETVGTRPIYDLTITAGDATISDLGGGTATVGVPYTPAEGEDINQIVIYYMSDSGELVMVPNCVYDPETGIVSFATQHFSKYAVGYNEISFSDVSGWYEDSVNYLAARGMINGKGNGVFTPDANITRAEFVRILANLSGDDLEKYKGSAFADVDASKWYSAAVQWANANDVVTGYKNKFNPNASITKQDLAVMIERFAMNVTGYTLPDKTKAVTFTDHQDISEYAVDSIRSIQQAGIISGNPDGSFKPAENASRAQAAKMVSLLLRGMLKD